MITDMYTTTSNFEVGCEYSDSGGQAYMVNTLLAESCPLALTILTAVYPSCKNNFQTRVWVVCSDLGSGFLVYSEFLDVDCILV